MSGPVCTDCGATMQNVAGMWRCPGLFCKRHRNAALIVAAVNALPALLDVAEAAQAYRTAQRHRHPEPHDDWADRECSRCLGAEYGCEFELDAALDRLDGAS